MMNCSCRTRTDESFDFNSNRDYKEIVPEMLSWIGLDNTENLNVLYEFMMELQNYSYIIPLRRSTIPPETRSQNIIS